MFNKNLSSFSSNRDLRAVLEIGNSSIFEQFRAVFTDFCSKLLENCSEKIPCSKLLNLLKNAQKFNEH